LKTIKLIALILVIIGVVIIGALNWGLVGLLSLDLVAAIFGYMSLLSRIVYTLVGISAVYIALISGKLLKE
jgi:uncharacterized membrane protein YuzA (DUF378 family)